MRGLPILLVAACAAKQPAPKPVMTKTVVREREEVTLAPKRGHRSTTLTPEVVVATIKDHYLAGVQRCYRRHAKMYGASNGRVMLRSRSIAKAKRTTAALAGSPSESTAASRRNSRVGSSRRRPRHRSSHLSLALSPE